MTPLSRPLISKPSPLRCTRSGVSLKQQPHSSVFWTEPHRLASWVYPGVQPPLRHHEKFARPAQIADGLLLERRRPHRRQQPCTPQFRDLAGITGICLHPLARFPGDQRRRDHVAAHAHSCHLPLQGVAAGARFVEDPHRSRVSRSSVRTKRRTAFGSFGSCHVTGVGAAPRSIAIKRSFLCASIPTYVVACS